MSATIILFFIFAIFITILSLASKTYITKIITSLFAGLMWIILAANTSSVIFATMFGIFGMIVMILGILNLM